MDRSEWMTVREAADHAGVSQIAVRQTWIRKGYVRVRPADGWNPILVCRKDVERVMATRATGGKLSGRGKGWCWKDGETAANEANP